MRAVIVANGDIIDYDTIKEFLKDDDYYICADGAIRHFAKLGIVPDLWIGDFDSCNYDDVCKTYPQFKNVKTLTLNRDKDLTDTQASCDKAIETGADDIVMIGSYGTRIDHSLSNIYLLEYLDFKGVKGLVITEKVSIRLVRANYNFVPTKKYISLIPLDEKVVVSKTQGLKYNLEKFTMYRKNSLGVSNEPNSEEVIIEVGEGKLLIIESND